MNINNPTTFSTPALVYSTSNSSGSAGALRADDTLAVFSTTVPTDISTSTVSAATGDNAFASREDHVHGSTAVLAVASQAQEEAASSTTVITTPGRQHFHPSALKVWAMVDANGTLNNSYNVASASKVATGDYDIQIATDLSASTYPAVATPYGATLFSCAAQVSTTDIDVNTFNSSDSAADVAFSMLCAGDL